MATAILCACVSCGADFEFNKHKSNKYCSVDCYRVAQRRGDYKRGHGPAFPRAPCAHCGAEVRRDFATRRDGSRSDKVFCNRDCYDSYRESNEHRVPGRGIYKCVGCSKAFSKLLTDSKAYCDGACWRAKRKAKPKHCVNCGCWFTPMKRNSFGKLISVNARKTCSRECQLDWYRNNEERKKKIGAAFAGEKHPNWQGGKSIINSTSNRGPNWSKQRMAAIKRDRCCVDCGMTNDECRVKFGRTLDVDHVVPYHNFNSYIKANKLANLSCRCASCHRIAEAKRSMVQMVLPMQDNAKRGHKGYVFGERVNTAKITSQDVIEIRQRADKGERMYKISDSMGISRAIVYQVVSGRTWKHLPVMSQGAGL